jgi:hypothetical protein
MLDSLPTAIAWSYAHLPIFAAVAAVGAGLVVAIEETSGHAHLGWTAVGLTVAVPLVVYLVALYGLYVGLLRDRVHRTIVPVATVAVVLAAFTPAPLLAIGLVLAGLVVAKVALRIREPVEAPNAVGSASPEASSGSLSR